MLYLIKSESNNELKKKESTGVEFELPACNQL